MQKLFSPYLRNFKPFSTSHLIALLVIFLLTILIFIFKKSLAKENVYKSLRIFIPIWVVFIFIADLIWLIATKSFDIKYNLPLHLCDISSLLIIPLFLFENQLVFEILYFIGIGSSLQALATPSLVFDFPHIIYFYFFSYHGIVLLGTSYYASLNKFKINFYSVIKAFVLFNIIGVIILIINVFLKSNYMFLFEKPQPASLMDALGPWPYYLIVADMLAFINCMIFYIPYAIYNKLKKRNRK